MIGMKDWESLGPWKKPAEDRPEVWSLPGRVSELHFVAVDDVTEQLSVDARHAALDVELANEPGTEGEADVFKKLTLVQRFM